MSYTIIEDRKYTLVSRKFHTGLYQEDELIYGPHNASAEDIKSMFKALGIPLHLDIDIYNSVGFMEDSLKEFNHRIKCGSCR